MEILFYSHHSLASKHFVVFYFCLEWWLCNEWSHAGSVAGISSGISCLHMAAVELSMLTPNSNPIEMYCS